MSLSSSNKVRLSIREPSGPVTLGYGAPYLWTVTEVSGVSKWGTDLWDACAATYYYSLKDESIRRVIENVVGGPLTANKLQAVIKAISTSNSNGKNYFNQIEVACKKPLFLHPGIDYGIAGEVQSIAPGTVKAVVTANKTNAGFSGKAVYIEHEVICTGEDKKTRTEKFYAAYYHLDKLAQGLKVGKGVQAGSPIAGATYTWPNTTTGNRHLHLEVHSQPGLFDRWKPSDSIQSNMFSYIHDARFDIGVSNIYETNMKLSEFKEKVSGYLKNNPPKRTLDFKQSWVKKSAEGAITEKSQKLNSDMFLRTLAIFLSKPAADVLRALKEIDAYKNVYNNSKNFSTDEEVPTVAPGYLDPNQVFSEDFISKLAPPK